jgi:uncharacterized protein YneF (UPF0154 family)
MKVLAMLIGALVLIALVIFGAYSAYKYLKGKQQ